RNTPDTEHIEEPGSDEPQPGRRVSLALGARVALDGEAERGPEQSCITPGHEAPASGRLDACQLAATPGRFLLKVHPVRAGTPLASGGMSNAITRRMSKPVSAV